MNDVALDTSALLRVSNLLDPKRSVTLATLDRLASEGARFVLFPQVVAEFYVVATRPLEVNGLGAPVEIVDAQITDFLTWASLQPEDRSAFFLWRRLVRESNIVGKRMMPGSRPLQPAGASRGSSRSIPVTSLGSTGWRGSIWN